MRRVPLFFGAITQAMVIWLFTSATMLSQSEPGRPVGNELSKTKDAVTGEEVWFLTDSKYQNGIFYPHSHTWSDDGRYVWFTSSRPRPDGTSSPGEMQLMAADTETGNLYWLATLGGKGEFPNREIFNHADYATGTKVIVFFDMAEHDLYAYRPADHKLTHLYSLKSGTLGHPPTLSKDGRRLVVWAIFPGPTADEFFKGSTHAIISFDLDESGMQVVGQPHLVTAFPTRVIPNAAEALRDHINISHAQVNPVDPDLIAFCHGTYAYPDGSAQLSRMWKVRVDGSDEGLILPTPKDRWQTHELWGPDGKWMYYVDTGELRRVSVSNGAVEIIAKELPSPAWHVSVSEDQMRLAFDSQKQGSPPDANDNLVGEVWWYDVKNKIAKHLATQLINSRFHTHAHPKISPDGQKIAFNVAEGTGSRVAIVKLPPSVTANKDADIK